MTASSSKRVVPTDIGYDLWSAIYDEENNPLIRLDSDYLPPVLGVLSGLDVLELGCGTGRQSLRMAAMGAKVTAVDFSDGMLSRARAKTGTASVRLLKADLNERLPLAGRPFDRVVSFLALDHVAALDLLFQEMERLCRPDGQIVISVMHPAIMLHGVEAHFHDPDTGEEIWPQSPGNSFSDYVMAASRAGFRFEHLSEHSVDEALAEYAPGVRKHIGWPLLLLARLRPV